jgi:hypothetical protein
VVGGSYPGAMSAWFRSRYPHLTVASWSSSGVVQPMNDFSAFDNQVYTSTAKSSLDCPRMIQETSFYIQNEGYKRLGGDTDNLITTFLEGTINEGMETSDFLFYYADIFVESV